MFQSMNVLCAEDEDLYAELLRRVLDGAPTKFLVTKTLRDTIDQASKGPWDIILLDLRLIDSDAESTKDEIRTLKRVSGAPVVVVTGMPIMHLREKCIAAGADGFVEKSIEFSATSHALRIAVIAAQLHHPEPRSAAVMERVRILERLVEESNAAKKA